MFYFGLGYEREESVEMLFEKDMETLKNVGSTHLRVFPLWSVFQPLYAIYVITKSFKSFVI